jgi:hypothetical protein
MLPSEEQTMSSQAIGELRAFHRFLSEKVDAQEANISPEEALDEWRRANPPADADEDVAAVREALVDMANGDHGVPFEEFDREFPKSPRYPI